MVHLHIGLCPHAGNEVILFIPRCTRGVEKLMWFTCKIMWLRFVSLFENTCDCRTGSETS